MTMYRHASGALVFGAGTIQWAWALDSDHDRGSAAADPAAQQATVNLFADMGAQPTTLRPGLVAASASTDTTATHLDDHLAAAGGTTVPVGNPVTVSGTAADAGGGRVGGVEVSTDNGTTWHRATGRETWSYSFTPSSNGSRSRCAAARPTTAPTSGAASTGVTLTVGERRGHLPVHDLAGHGDARDDRPRHHPGRARREVPHQHRRLHHRHPLLQARHRHRHPRRHPVDRHRHQARPPPPSPTRPPAAGSRPPSPTPSPSPPTPPTSPPTSPPPATPSTPTTSPPPPPADHSPPWPTAPTAATASTATAPPPAPSPTSTYNNENYWVDVVFNDIDTTKPTVTARTPAPGATGVAVGVDVTATFSEAVQQASVSLELRGPGGTLVPAATSYDAATRTSHARPQRGAEPDHDLHRQPHRSPRPAGNTMDPVTWTFTTGRRRHHQAHRHRTHTRTRRDRRGHLDHRLGRLHRSRPAARA